MRPFSIIFLLAPLLLADTVLAQTASAAGELTCRNQAKEVALQTYNLCISNAQSKQVEEIKKAYQEELAQLKAKYELQLAKLEAPVSSPQKPVVAVQNITPAQSIKAETPVKGVAKKLPAKKNIQVEALPIQTITEGSKVVNAELSRQTEDYDTELRSGGSF